MRKSWAEIVLSKLPIPPITDYSRLIWRMYDLMYNDGTFSRLHIYNGCSVTDLMDKMRDVAGEEWQLKFTAISDRECFVQWPDGSVSRHVLVPGRHRLERTSTSDWMKPVFYETQ